LYHAILAWLSQLHPVLFDNVVVMLASLFLRLLHAA
jgi:hypothetical protein